VGTLASGKGWMFAKRIMVEVTAASMAGGTQNSTEDDSQRTRVKPGLQTTGPLDLLNAGPRGSLPLTTPFGLSTG
jgi:hypothetical protein